MRSIFLTIYLFLVCCNVMAEKIIRTIDIINTSDLPVTVTYDICNFLTIKSSPGNYIPQKLNCTEKTSILNQKNSGSNYIFIEMYGQKKARNEGEEEITPFTVFIKKITSSLGVQTLISTYEEKNEIYKKLHESDYHEGAPSYCIAVAGSDIQLNNNVVTLDNLGTSRFYCSSMPRAY